LKIGYIGSLKWKKFSTNAVLGYIFTYKKIKIYYLVFTILNVLEMFSGIEFTLFIIFPNNFRFTSFSEIVSCG